MIYKIGSFNMKNFGAGSHKDLDKIAEIICEEELDVVALQEILSEGKGVERLLEQSMKYGLYDWDFRCASPNMSDDIDKIKDTITGDRRGECYAYLWNKKRFKLVEYSKLGEKRVFEPRIINSMSNDVNINCDFFARTPYYIRLQPIYGGFFELRLINIHIYYGDKTLSSIQKRRVEYEVLTREIYPMICSKRYGQFRTPYTVAMGDYNLNLFSPNVATQDRNCYISQSYSCFDGGKNIEIITGQKQLSTLRIGGEETENDGTERYANNFDHFTYSPQLSDFVGVSFEAVDAVNKYCKGDFAYYNKNISDHLPIVMTVEI